MTVKIPLKWYSDLIKIPSTDNEFLLLEWFEEKECKNKTIWCLGKFIKVSQYLIIEQSLKEIPNDKLTQDLLNNRLNKIKLGEYVQENNFYFPPIYMMAKNEKWFEGEI